LQVNYNHRITEGFVRQQLLHAKPKSLRLIPAESNAYPLFLSSNSL
jgi:hypothetical protein